MTIREAKENGMYADIEVSDIEDIDGFMDMNINDFPHAEMNGCEFYLYLQKDYPAWKAFRSVLHIDGVIERKVDEMNTIRDTRRIKARKTHICDYCDKQIAVGEKHEVATDIAKEWWH